MSVQIFYNFDFLPITFPLTDPNVFMEHWLDELQRSVEQKKPIFYGNTHVLENSLSILRNRLSLEKTGTANHDDREVDLLELSFSPDENYEKNCVDPGSGKIYYPLLDWLQIVRPRSENGGDYQFFARQTDEHQNVVKLGFTLDVKGNATIREDGTEYTCTPGKMRE